mgnify:CR=1 FL=1
MLVGRTGAVAVGSTENCDLTPGVALVAYPESSTADPAQAGLLLSTCPFFHTSLAWMAVMSEGESPSASLIMLHSSANDCSSTFLLSDSISISNNDTADILLDDENRVYVRGETVNIANTADAGVFIEPNGSVTIRLGSSD